MSTGFYKAFEDRFRGSREEIKARLQVYQPFVALLTSLRDDCSAVDLGCGRGEWLELLREWGVNGYGIDLDEDMLVASREMGLNVETGDAIAFIRSLPDESQDIVAAFHFVEHITFEDLQTLVQEAQRVLKPAGLLILETQNPENLEVGSSKFHLDPTHRNPIPPLLLSFLAEYYSFFRAKILRLQESPELAGRNTVNLFEVLTGSSPDYSLVAQKDAPNEQLALFHQVFDKEYGLTLQELSARYDQQAIFDLAATREEMKALRADMTGLRFDASALRDELAAVRVERDRLHIRLDEAQADRDQMRAMKERAMTDFDRMQAEIKYLSTELNARQKEAEEYRHQYFNVLYSLSYRITAPLRAFYTLLYKTRTRLRGNSPAAQPVVQPAVEIISEQADDEKQYQTFFLREINKRRKAKKDNQNARAR